MLQGFQVNALVRKSWTYQRKNISMNVCVLMAPIVVAILLASMQTLLDDATAEDQFDRCGCECTLCDDDRADGNFYLRAPGAPTTTECSYTYNDEFFADEFCRARNTSNCGIQYSIPRQLMNCAVVSPPLWPPIYELNGLDYTQLSGQTVRSDQGVWTASVSSTTFLHTAENEFSNAAMQHFLRDPNFDAVLSDPSIVADFQRLLDEDLDIEATSLVLKKLVAAADWDFGVFGSEMESLYIDAFITNVGGGVPYQVLQNCTALLPVLNYMESTGAIPELGSRADRILGACVQTFLKRVATAEDINLELYCTHYESTREVCGPSSGRAYAGAIDWRNTEAGSLNINVHNEFDEAFIPRITKPIARAIGAFLEEWLGEEYRSRLVALTGMPKPDTSSKVIISISSFVGPLFFTWLLQLPLPWAVVQLVYEKQHRLRNIMRMHGLSNGVYVLIMYLYFVVQYYMYAAIVMISGVAARLDIFTSNGGGVQIIFYIMYGNMQVAFAFLLSCFFSGTRVANIVCWIWILGSALFGQFLLNNVFANERWWAVLVQFIPTFAVYRGLWELSQYAVRAGIVGNGAKGMTLADVGENGMRDVLLIFLVEWIVFMGAAWYLEQVLSTATGIRKHWLFPFQFSKTSRKKAGALYTATRSDEADLNLAEDVLRERERAHTIEPGEENPIVLCELRKEFHNPKKVAVQNLSLAISKGECFGLLGPNGAGKSTSINMMIGFMEATAGAAFINGMDLRTDLNEIYTFMGVCPQDNLLWETLTAREHLNFYGRLKQLSGKELVDAVDEALKSVNLFDVANKRSGQFSGGMKRRLSCAISLIGNPVVTYMDEPSTGLDPSARRQLWDTIANAKEGKAMVLTTHSMEEAERLCDRLGIFVNGQLACVGPPKALAARYGGYNVLTITTPEAQVQAAKDFVHSMCPTSTCTYSLAGTCKWHLPKKDIQFSKVFDHIQTVKEDGQLTILDWGVHSASLEEVFIRLAQKELDKEDESAAVINMNNFTRNAAFESQPQSSSSLSK